MKKFSLAVSEPCHENWEAMTSAGKGRHCASCQKTVVDFTAMTDSQVASFFKQSPQNVCGRFYNNQLNREIMAPPRSLPLPRQLLQLSLPALLLMSSCEQEKVVTMGDTVTVNEDPIKFAVPTMGMVMQNIDTTDTVVSFSEPITRQCSSVIVGDVELKPDHNDSDTANIVTKGHDEIVAQGCPEESPVHSKLSPEFLKEEPFPADTTAIIMGRIELNPEKKTPVKAGETLQKNDIKIDEAKRITLYPNPVSRGQMLTVLFHRKMTCLYQVTTLAGQVVSTGRLTAEKGQPVQVRVGVFAPGTYSLRLAEEATGNVITEKFIVL
jgi:hypothetical protein